LKKLFLLTILIAVSAAFFASTHPDGLDFVAGKLGFADKGIERAAPMPNYSVPFLPAGCVSISAAGIAGVLIVLGIFRLAAYFIKTC